MDPSEPRSVTLGNRTLLCVACGHDLFFLGEGIVPVHGATALGLEIGNPMADLAACASCGFLHSFVRFEDSSAEGPG